MGLRDKLKAKGIDCILLSNWNRLDINSLYLASCQIEHSFLFWRKGRTVLLLPKMELERGRKECMADRTITIGKDLKKQLKRQLKGVKKLGLNLSLISVAEYKLIRKAYKGRIVDAGRILLEVRREKTGKEMLLYRKACRLTDQVMQKTISAFGSFSTEQDAYEFMRTETEKLGCSFSFEPIIASGRKASMPHSSRKGRLEKGFCIIDYGLKYKGYCTDITRTIYLGKPSEADTALYDKVLAAQKECIGMCQSHVKCSDVYKVAVKRLGDFMHGLGHGIGLQIHELPNISPYSKEVFAEDMLFTIEPGLYIPGKKGIRIEDDVCIRNGKPVVLTKTGKGLVVIR